MKNRHDLKAKEVTFNTGDSVWLYNPKRRKGLCPKLQSDWEGPIKVVKQLSDLIYRIQMPGQRKQRVVHVNCLAPYITSEETQQSLES